MSKGIMAVNINDGVYTIVQTYKVCNCQSTGVGERQIAIHKRAKKVCGEDCLRYRLSKME